MYIYFDIKVISAFVDNESGGIIQEVCLISQYGEVLNINDQDHDLSSGFEGYIGCLSIKHPASCFENVTFVGYNIEPIIKSTAYNMMFDSFKPKRILVVDLKDEIKKLSDSNPEFKNKSLYGVAKLVGSKEEYDTGTRAYAVLIKDIYEKLTKDDKNPMIYICECCYNNEICKYVDTMNKLYKELVISHESVCLPEAEVRLICKKFTEKKEI